MLKAHASVAGSKRFNARSLLINGSLYVVQFVK